MSTVDMRTESSYDGYETPVWLVQQIRDFFGGTIELDPCTSESNPCGARQSFTFGGLEEPWSAANVYMNSPFGRQLSAWCDKFVGECWNYDEGIALTPARMGTRWFQDMVRQCDATVEIGRLQFTIDGKPVTDSKGRPCTAQFDSCLHYIGGRVSEFHKHFENFGTFWRIDAAG